MDAAIETTGVGIPEGASSVLAGYVAGSCGLLVGHPLDSLKVLLQTAPPTAAESMSSTSASAPAATAAATPNGTTSSATSKMSTAMPQRHQSSLSPPTSSTSLAQKRGNAAAAFSPSASVAPSWRDRSIRSLYAGIGVPLATVGLVQAVNFFLYDSLRRRLYARDVRQSGADDGAAPVVLPSDYLHYDSLTNVAVASFAAGAAVGVATSPLMVIKTRQQLAGGTLSMRRAALGALRQVGGARNLFVGFAPHLACETLGRSIYFASYEALKRQLLRRKRDRHVVAWDGERSVPLSIPERMACASASGMLCWAVIFPMDVLRSKTYALAQQQGLAPVSPLTGKSESGTRLPSTTALARDLWSQGGWRPFFRGFGITVARAGPVAAVVLPVYDKTFEWLTSGEC